jgi:hypothetical protein
VRAFLPIAVSLEGEPGEPGTITITGSADD